MNICDNIQKINKKKCLKIIIIILFDSYFLFLFNYKIISSPKISVFLPIYNKAKYLKRSIGSIQIQTLKKIEIIPVNDCSNDNSLEILKEMGKSDRRIKIVNNKKNGGLLYSRTMGILNSKGKYLMNLDPDDELNGSDSLEYLYNKAIEANADIVCFGFLKEIKSILTKQKIFKCKNYNQLLNHIQIHNYGHIINDFLITNKLVKKDIFLRAVQQFKHYIFGMKWNYGEDEIWSTLVYKHSNSLICINKIIFIYHSNNDSLMNNRFNALFFSNIYNWLLFFIKTYKKKNEYVFLKRKIKDLIKLTNNKNFLITMKNNKYLMNKYITILQNIITNYKICVISLQKIINSLKN